MTGGFIICEYEEVKDYFPEFQANLDSLHVALVSKAQADWAPKTFGGLTPRADQFGETTVMPELFRDIGNTTLTTWNQYLSSTGNQTIMSGSNSGNIYEDYKIGLAGLAFLDKSILISEIRMQISDKKLPRINVEEAMAYNKPAIVFEDSYILDEETGFDLYAYVLALGYQRLSLIGFQLNRVPNKLQTTNTGAALV